MDKFKSVLMAVLIVGPAFYFGFIGKPTEMGLAIVMGAMVGAFLNLDRFVRFKGAGFEAELKEAVKEAYATIENMREIAKPLIVTALSCMAYANRFNSFRFFEKQKYREELLAVAKTVQLSDDADIQATVDKLNQYLGWDLFNRIVMRSPSLGLLSALQKYRTNDFPSEETIRKVFEKAKMTIDNDLEQKILDYSYYLNNKTIRRDTI